MWWKTNSDVLVKFIEARGISDEQARAVLGIALLAQGVEEPDEDPVYRLVDLLDAASVTLDTPLLLEVLESASAAQIAGVLWNPIGLHFSTAQFERLYRIVLDASPSDSTLYELVGAAVDFLRNHPGAFSISQDIVSRLLESPHVDSRIVAMKALSHSTVSLGYHVDSILRCLQRNNESDKDIGLYQLGELIEGYGSRLLQSLDSDRIQQLHRMLGELARDKDETRRIAAGVHRDALIELGNNGATKGGEGRNC
jgi:hypothetical protein